MTEIYLHGDLELHIIEARSLPNMKFHHRGECITSYSYVTVSVPQARVARTRVLSNSQNPKWDEHFHIPLAHPVEFLDIRIKNKDVFRSDTVGRVHIPAQRIASGNQISGWFPIDGFKQLKPDSALRLWIVFMPCGKNPLYGHGIAGDPLHRGVRNTYFPPRNGSSVTLYQDAHVTKMPEIELGDGSTREHAKCWEDLCHAIAEAKHLVYVVGWSVFHKIKLTREPTRPLPRGGDLTLGELLKYKSREGVRVLLLVWDDKTAYDGFFYKGPGVMKTHCKETRNFFQHSSVMCILASRHPSSKQQVAVHLFTHHQKCVLVDTQAHGNNRKITAFLGGLDLCDGRYDTPEHRLFHDLETVFKDDFNQPSFPARTKAPRQPWHDLHCRIEGPAAYDVLMNFAQRWQKITEWSEFSLVQKNPSRWKDDAMIDIERMSEILSPAFRLSKDGAHIAVPKDDPKLYVSRQKDPENWHVQIFRSIDSGSLRGFPTHYKEAEKQNLVCTKDLVIDKSIQTAYIQAIRSAQHFIYIENQYFLGSSYAWPSYHNAGVDHLIPMELALKIASKIRAKERFAVYVVIPMWPEGDPKHSVVQEILFWQGQTMEMMYQIIANEIKSMQLDSLPQDYLNFFCLGNREPIASTSAQAPGDAQEISDSYKFQRFMVYVHAKGMVVDDEYVIIGSANMNERSMAGTRDSEIAMGAYQPHHCWAKKKQHPRGQVYGYRMSLWAEHLGAVENYFDEPDSLDCVRSVNSIAEDNWKRYTCDEFTQLQGHLLKYPLLVDADGNVSPLPGHENFPDVGGSVLGAPRLHIPDILTT